MEQKTGIRAFQLDISPQELTSSLTLDDYDEDFNEIEQETGVKVNITYRDKALGG